MALAGTFKANRRTEDPFLARQVTYSLSWWQQDLIADLVRLRLLVQMTEARGDVCNAWAFVSSAQHLPLRPSYHISLHIALNCSLLYVSFMT